MTNNISIFDASNVDDVDNRLILKKNTDGITCLANQESNTGAKSRARGRFGKIAPNANHPLTVSMRRMKDDLQLTTKQLVSELDAFESEYGLPNDNHGVSRDYIAINPILMSSYLQGWVLQVPFISAVHNRLHQMYEHKTKSRSDSDTCDFNELFPEWFKMLGIPDSDSNTRLRTFSRIIAPYYKRAVLTRFPGVFRLGQSYGDIEQEYSIEGIDGIVHHFVLNRADEVLIEDGSVVSKSDLIQYSILYPIVMKNEKIYFDINSPSADHTKFFRWYQYGKSPRSLKDVELVKQAVIDAAKAATQNQNTNH